MVGKSYAQQDYFVLIQADNSQPFYLKIGAKSLSSTAKGRLILSQLKEGNLSFTIGFPRQLFPEQQFSINIDKDLEFQLKDLGEKGWGLFNPQTLELKAPDKKETSQDTKSEGIKKDDAFSRLMAGVVSDTAVMYHTYAMEEVLKDSPVAVTPVKKDTTTRERALADSSAAPSLTEAANNDRGNKTANNDAVKQTANNGPGAVPDTTMGTAAEAIVPPAKATVTETTGTPAKGTVAGTAGPSSTGPSSKGTVIKLSERKTPRGLRLAYADRPKGRKADTIVVIIPMDTVDAVSSVNQPIATPVTPEPLFRTKTDTQRTGEPLFRNRTDTARTVSGDPPAGADVARSRHDSIVHTSSDTIHVYLAPRKKVSKEMVDSSGASTNRRKPDTAPTAVTGKARPDSSRTAAATRTRSDSSRTATTTRTKPDSSRTAAVTRTKPDSSRTTAATRTKPDSSHTPAVRSKPVVVNSDCRNFATDYDVDRLRVKMLEGSKEDERLQAAKRVFKTKCFTTRQIKALSEVFTTDAEKFRFFESAYPFVSDDRFRDLTDLLADPVYNGKFRVMTGQQ